MLKSVFIVRKEWYDFNNRYYSLDVRIVLCCCSKYIKYFFFENEREKIHRDCAVYSPFSVSFRPPASPCHHSVRFGHVLKKREKIFQ